MGIFDGKRFFIYGDGLSGKAAKYAIKKQGGKAKIYSDVRGAFKAPPDAVYDGAVISPGIKPNHGVYEYCRAKGIKTLGEVEIGFEIAGKTPIVGVTGTNGKTTTTRLIAAMLGGIACGNIGYPLSAAALKNKAAKPLVCELSSFQLFNANITPDIAVITNMNPDHVDWHGSEEEYYKSKCRIAKNMRGVLVLGPDITVGALSSLTTEAETVECAVGNVCNGAYTLDGYFWFMGKRVCPIDYLRLSGEHNVKNALCAIAAAMCMGADNSAVLAALSSAAPSPHRTEIVGNYVGKQWIDDSKGTNVSACLAAVAETVGTVCLIVGGRSKDTDFTELFTALDERVTDVIAMGETAQKVRDSAAVVCPDRKITVVNGLADAVRAAEKSAAQTVLLSPACASFDEFKNYAARGDKFKAEVKALGKRK